MFFLGQIIVPNHASFIFVFFIENLRHKQCKFSLDWCKRIINTPYE